LNELKFVKKKFKKSGNKKLSKNNVLRLSKKLAKQAHLQLQKDILSTPQAPKKQNHLLLKQSIKEDSCRGGDEVKKVDLTVNRRGREIRLPQHYRR